MYVGGEGVLVYLVYVMIFGVDYDIGYWFFVVDCLVGFK